MRTQGSETCMAAPLCPSLAKGPLEVSTLVQQSPPPAPAAGCGCGSSRVTVGGGGEGKEGARAGRQSLADSLGWSCRAVAPLLRLTLFQGLTATLLSLILDTVSLGHFMDPPTPGFRLLIQTLYFGFPLLLRVFLLSKVPLRQPEASTVGSPHLAC